MDALLSFALKLVLAILDRWIDREMTRLHLDPKVRADLEVIENELVRLLEGPVGQAIARAFGRAILKAKFANDPSTGTWAG